jgi:hypothetical protein
VPLDGGCGLKVDGLWGSDNGWRGGEGGQFLDSRGGSSRSESKYIYHLISMFLFSHGFTVFFKRMTVWD